MTALASSVVLIPIRSFGGAKLRLANGLDEPRRRALMVEMAERVFAASSPLPVAVITADHEVATWAASRGALHIVEIGQGLNSAVQHGVSHLADAGADLVIVAHADLPRATGISAVGHPGRVSIVPDRHRQGTNVIAIPSHSGFRFAYGAGSFERHLREARRCGLDVDVIDDPSLAFDVDLESDLAELGACAGPATSESEITPTP